MSDPKTPMTATDAANVCREVQRIERKVKNLSGIQEMTAPDAVRVLSELSREVCDIVEAWDRVEAGGYLAGWKCDHQFLSESTATGTIIAHYCAALHKATEKWEQMESWDDFFWHFGDGPLADSYAREALELVSQKWRSMPNDIQRLVDAERRYILEAAAVMDRVPEPPKVKELSVRDAYKMDDATKRGTVSRQVIDAAFEKHRKAMEAEDNNVTAHDIVAAWQAEYRDADDKPLDDRKPESLRNWIKNQREKERKRRESAGNPA